MFILEHFVWMFELEHFVEMFELEHFVENRRHKAQFRAKLVKVERPLGNSKDP